MYIYSNAKNRRSGSAMQKVPCRGELSRRDMVRLVLPGFPAKPFVNRKDVEKYVGGDRVACLMCGKYYKSVGAHIKLHDMDVQEYRLRFNIPWQYPLSSNETREKKRALGFAPENMERVAKMHSLVTDRAKKKNLTALTLSVSQANIKGVKRQRIYGDDYSWHLEQARTVFAYREVPVPEGMASWRTVKRRRSCDPKLRAAFEAAKAERLRNQTQNREVEKERG